MSVNCIVLFIFTDICQCQWTNYYETFVTWYWHRDEPGPHSTSLDYRLWNFSDCIKTDPICRGNLILSGATIYHWKAIPGGFGHLPWGNYKRVDQQPAPKEWTRMEQRIVEHSYCSNTCIYITWTGRTFWPVLFPSFVPSSFNWDPTTECRVNCE